MENDLKTADSDSEFDAAFKAGIAAPKKTTASTATPVAAGAVASSPTEDNAENEFNAAFYSSNPQAAPSSQLKKAEQYGPSKDEWERDQEHNRTFKKVLEETKSVPWEKLSQAQQQFFGSQYEPRYIGMIPGGYPLTPNQQKAYGENFIQAVSGKRHQDLTQSEEKLLGSINDPNQIKQIPKHFILTEEQKRILHDHEKAESYLTLDNAASVISGFGGMIKDSVEGLWKVITEAPAPASPTDALMLKATAGGDTFEAFQNKQAEKSRKNVADITSPAAQLPEDLSEFGNRIAEGGMRPADWLEEKLGLITPEQAFQRFSLRKDVETAFEAQRHEMPSAWARAIYDQQALSDPIMSAFGAALDPRPWSGPDGVGLVERYKTSSSIVDGMRQSGALEEQLKLFGPEDPDVKTFGMFTLPYGSGMGVFGAAGAGLKIGSAGYSALRSGAGNVLRGAESARIVANGLERARMNRINSAVKGLEEEVKRFDGLAADAAKEGKTLSSLDMPVPQGPTNLNVARAVSNASGKAPSIEGWRPLDRNALQQSLMQKGKSAEEAFNLARQEALKEAQAIGGMGLFGANAGEALAINTAKETAEKLRFEMKLEGRSEVGFVGRLAGKTEGKMEEVVKGLDDLASKTPEVVKAFAPYVAGGAVGLLSSDEHPVLGALGGAGGGKLLTKTPKLIGKSAGLVRALSEARAISAGGSVGTFETLGRTGLPAGGEKAALGLSQSGRLADKTLDFFTDVLMEGANAGLLATAIGMGESADAEQMMNLVGQGWLFAAKHGIQAKGIRAIKSLASQEPQFTAREAAQRRVDDAKAYRDMTPESKKAFDYASSWDAQVERQEELLKAAQLDHWRESNKDPNSKETKDAAVKIEFQEKQLDQFKRADIPTRSLYGRSLARQLGELQKLLNGTLREGQNNVGIHILTRDQIVSHFLNGRDPSRVSPEEVQEILIKANQKGIYSNPANGSAGAFDPAKPSMVLNADSIRARIVYLGESASQAMWHEAGHHLMHVPEFIDAIAPQMDALFGKTITQADGTVLEETPGSLSNKDLVERYLDSKTGYMKNKTPERMKIISQVLGLWDDQNDALNEPAVAEYMKGEIAADLVAEGMSNSLGGNLDSKVKHAMDLARVKAKMGLLDKMRARLGFLFDAAALSDSPEAISKETGVAFTPEMMAATRIALRRIRDLNGEFSGTGEESEGPKVTRAQMMSSKAQRDRYGKESGMFKTELVAQIVDAAGKPVGEPVVISSPGAMEGFWQNTFNVTLPAEKLSKTNGFGELPAQLRLSPVSGNGGIKITSRIATEADGVTPITLSPRESRELLKSRGVVIRESLNTPDDGTPGRFEAVSEGSQTYRGTFTPAQIQAIRNLPESIIPASIKAKMLKINEIVSRKDGTRIVIDYAAMMNDKGKYVAYSPKIYDLVPIGMHLSKDGNFLATTISYGRLLSKLNAWAERKPGILSPWNGNKELFMQVFVNKYLRNWQYREQGPDGVEMYPNGRPGEYGLDRDPEMAKAKKDIFNDFLNLTNDLTPADAPRTTTPRRVGDPRGKNIDRTIMSARMDHIAELIENESAPKVPINYRNAVTHFAPEEAELLDESARQDAPRSVEDARRSPIRFSLEEGAQDAQNGVESPLAKAYLDLSNTRELFKFGLVSQKTRDKAGKVIEGLPATIREYGEPREALTVGKAEQVEYAQKAKKLFEVIAKDVMPGVKIKTSANIDRYGDELAVDVGDSTIYIIDFTSVTPHINSTEVGRGNNGAALYQVVNDWANAFGKTIIGDPGGITEINIIRRTGNMISSALRSGGGTDAWEPEAKRQGVDWVIGDHAGNLTNLLAREAELSRNIAPELQYLKYDLNTGEVAFNGFSMNVKRKLRAAIDTKRNQQLYDLNAAISFNLKNQSNLSERNQKRLEADIKKKKMLESLDLHTPEGFLNAIAALNYGEGLGAATARRAVITQSLGDFSPAKRQPAHKLTKVYEDFTPKEGPLDVGKVASSLAKQKFSLFASPEEAIDEVKLSLEQGAKDVQKGVESPLAKAYLDLSNTKELFKFGLVSQETSNKVEQIVRELPLSIRTPGNNYRAGKLTVSEPEQNEYAAKATEALKLIVEDVMPGAGASVDYEINQYGDRLNISVGNAVLSIENFTARKPHINSVSVGRGNNGAGMYQAANDWAISLGKTIIGDLGGITDVNIIRRTGNMISSVLRAGGDTNSWEPELRQQGVSWTAGDDVGNLTNLLVREAELARRIAPELQYLTYDLRTGNLDFSGNAIRSRNNIAVSIAPKLKAKIKQLEEDIEYYKSDPLPITPRIAERIKSDLQQIEVMKSMPLNTPESFLDAIAAIHYREGVGSATARRTVITQSLGEFSKTNRSPLSLDNVYEDFTPNKGPVDVSNVASSLAKQRFSLFASPEETNDYVKDSIVAPGFYSKAGKVLLEKMPARTSSGQIKGILDPQKGSGVKPDELKWSGLIPYVESVEAAKGFVTKDDVRTFLKDGYGAKFEEHKVGTNADGNSFYSIDERWGGEGPVEFDTISNAVRAAEQMFELSHQEAVQFVDETNQSESLQTDNGVKYSKYSLPGGTDYKETVLTMPGVEYTSSHFGSVPSYVAHMRTAKHGDGLLIEEIQSDLHQQGRKQGYNVPIDPKTYSATPNEVSYGMWDVKDATGSVRGFYGSSAEEAISAAVARDSMYKKSVPDAPFKKDWPLQLFKRALKQAVADGKEWIGWTGGVEQAARYPGAAKAEGMTGFYDVMLPNEIGKYVKQWGAKIKQSSIEAEIDNSVVRTVWDEPDYRYTNNGWVGVTSGNELPVGSPESMALSAYIGRYDESQITGAAKQILRSGDIVGHPKKEAQIWRIDITPEMREKVKRGQTYFSPEETRDEVEKIERAVYRNPRTWEVTEGGTHLSANPAGPQEPTDRETPNYAFRTTAGRVVSRKEALEIAKNAGQILDNLTPEQQDYLDRGVLHSGMYQPSEAKGVNVNSASQPYADMIVSGDKTIETRDSRSLDSLIGRRVGIIRTGGKGKGQLTGSAVVGEPIEYRSEEEFRADESRHKVPKDDKYDIKEGGVKYGYSMSDVRPLEPSEISGGGRVISNLAGTRFSLEEDRAEVGKAVDQINAASAKTRKATQSSADTLAYPVNPVTDSVALVPRWGLINKDIVGMPKNQADVIDILDRSIMRLKRLVALNPSFARESARFYRDMAECALLISDITDPNLGVYERFMLADLNNRFLALGSPRTGVSANASKSQSSAVARSGGFAAGWKIGFGSQQEGAKRTAEAWNRGEHFDLAMEGVQDKVRSFYLNGLSEIIEMAEEARDAESDQAKRDEYQRVVDELTLRAAKSMRIVDGESNGLTDAQKKDIQRLLDGKATVDMWDMAAKGFAWPGWISDKVARGEVADRGFHWTQEKFAVQKTMADPEWKSALEELGYKSPADLRYQEARSFRIDGNKDWDSESWKERKKQPFDTNTAWTDFTERTEAGLSPGGGGPLYDAQQGLDGMMADRLNQLGMANLFGKRKLKARNAQEILWALEKLDNPLKGNNDLSLYGNSFMSLRDELMKLRSGTPMDKDSRGIDVLAASQRVYKEMSEQSMPLEVVTKGTSKNAQVIRDQIEKLRQAGDPTPERTFTLHVANNLHNEVNAIAKKNGVDFTIDQIEPSYGGYTEGVMDISENFIITARGNIFDREKGAFPAAYAFLEGYSRGADQAAGNVIRRASLRELYTPEIEGGWTVVRKKSGKVVSSHDNKETAQKEIESLAAGKRDYKTKLKALENAKKAGDKDAIKSAKAAANEELQKQIENLELSVARVLPFKLANVLSFDTRHLSDSQIKAFANELGMIKDSQGGLFINGFSKTPKGIVIHDGFYSGDMEAEVKAASQSINALALKYGVPLPSFEKSVVEMFFRDQTSDQITENQFTKDVKALIEKKIRAKAISPAQSRQTRDVIADWANDANALKKRIPSMSESAAKNAIAVLNSRLDAAVIRGDITRPQSLKAKTEKGFGAEKEPTEEEE